MNKPTTILVAGILSFMWFAAASAQNAQTAAPEGEVPPPPRFEEEVTPRDTQSGLQVEERRYENRLDGVTVEHEKSGLREYYNLNDPDVDRRDGGIAEGSAMRTWRLGGGN